MKTKIKTTKAKTTNPLKIRESNHQKTKSKKKIKKENKKQKQK